MKAQMNEKWDFSYVLWACVYSCSWYCIKIEWFGIKAINISLGFDGGP